MKFSVGYQLQNNDSLINTIIENKENINEVYFSFGDFPNGRGKLNDQAEISFLAQQKQLEDLKRLGDMPLNLLLNGNCYGKYALARSFYNKVGDTVEYLLNSFNLQTVTTTSPLIARFIKENFTLQTRASVNMNIDTIEGFEYVLDLFDSFYLSREHNRNLNKIKKIREFLNSKNKGLYGLANSGCLKNCSAHTFHDNLVAHEDEVKEMDNAYLFEGQCKTFFSKKENRENWLRYMTFIRPEDASLYEGLFDGLKIATRVNKNPEQVIKSYIKGSYSGAITEILEPNHTNLFYPEIIENKKIDPEFTKTVLNCNKDCLNCSYCKNVQKSATIDLIKGV